MDVSDGRAPRRRVSRFSTPRTAAVAALRDALDHHVVVLRGPAGIGKSTLLRRLADELSADDAVAVEIVDAADAAGITAALAALAGAREPAHIAIVDDVRDDDGLAQLVVDALRADPRLTVVVASRSHSGLDDPLIALEFDIHVVEPGAFVLSVDEVGDVLDRNGVSWHEAARNELHARAAGWAALVQLAAAHLRLEGMALSSEQTAAVVADTALRSFADRLCADLPMTSAPELRLAAVAPFLTAPLADALGLGGADGGSPGLLRRFQDAGLVWPSTQRLVVAEPIRRLWLGELERDAPEALAAAREAVVAHLACTAEPLLAARIAADAGDGEVAAAVLHDHAPAAWAHDREAFAALVAGLGQADAASPQLLALLLRLDPGTYLAPDAVDRAAAALSASRRADDAPIGLPARSLLQRSAGRFGAAVESASAIVAEGRSSERAAPGLTEAYLQAGISFFQSGRMKDAAAAVNLAVAASGEGVERTRARGLQALILTLEGHVAEAEAVLDALEQAEDGMLDSPWAHAARLAGALLALDRGDPAGALARLDAIAQTDPHPEYWALRAATGALAHLALGSGPDALAGILEMESRYRHVATSHFQRGTLLSARAVVLIALRQARRAAELFQLPHGPSDATAGSIGLALLFTGRDHDAFLFSQRWASRHEVSPRAALRSMIVNIVAALRLGNRDAALLQAQRAEVLSRRTGLWSTWGCIAPDERDAVLALVSPESAAEVRARPSYFASSATVPRLTARETVVLRLLRPTTTVADLARELVVSPNTIKTQLQSLYRKLGVGDRAAAIRAAAAWGLLDPDDAGDASRRNA